MATDPAYHASGIEGERTRYGDFVISPDSLPDDGDDFRAQIYERLPAWRAAGHKIIWLEVPTASAAVIPAAVEAGFRFHHADPDAVTLTQAPRSNSFVYPRASHYVGAGGVVIDEARRLLVVNERYRRDMSRPFYKLPGGLIHHGEDIEAGVRREVLEETGIETRFLAATSLRNRHTGSFGYSDLYIVCRLEPLTTEIVIQASEIQDCLWMPVAEYLASEHVYAFNRRIVCDALESPGLSCSRTAPDAEVFMAAGGVDGLL